MKKIIILLMLSVPVMQTNAAEQNSKRLDRITILKNSFKSSQTLLDSFTSSHKRLAERVNKETSLEKQQELVTEELNTPSGQSLRSSIKGFNGNIPVDTTISECMGLFAGQWGVMTRLAFCIAAST